MLRLAAFQWAFPVIDQPVAWGVEKLVEAVGLVWKIVAG